MVGRLGVSRSTIYAVLRRRGLSRLSDLDRPTGNTDSLCAGLFRGAGPCGHQKAGEST